MDNPHFWLLLSPSMNLRNHLMTDAVSETSKLSWSYVWNIRIMLSDRTCPSGDYISYRCRC